MRATAQALARSRTSDTDSLRLIFLEIQTVLSSKARKTYKSLARGAKRSGKPVILVFHRALLLSTVYNCIQTIPQPHIFTFFKAFNFSGQHFFFVRIPGKEKRTPRVHVLVFTKHLFSLASFFSLDKMKTE